jgi:outer membrane protein TolC
MKLFGILLVLAGVGTTALAQTNTPSAAAAYPAAPSAAAQAPRPANVRQLSLHDCIELALKHNLDLQFDRYDPQISFYGLRADYGAYDPVLTLSGKHDYSESGSQLLSGGFTIPGAISDDNSFSSGISGLLPWGTTYNLGTGRAIQDTYGSSGTTVPNFAQPLYYTTNTIVNLANGTPKTVTVLSTNYAVMPGSAGFENSAGSVGLTVTQPLLKNFWINNAQLTIRVAKNRLKYSEQNLRLQIMTTISTLEKAYYDLIYDRENVVVQEKAVELAERLVMENKKKLEVGTLAPLDLQSAEAQAANNRATLIAAQSQLDTQERLVKQLITDRYMEWVNISLQPSEKLTTARPIVNLQDSWNKGLTQRPEWLQAKLDIEKAGIQLKFSKNQLLPELDMFGTFGYSGSGREFSDALYDIQQRNEKYYTYGGQISLPLSNIGARNNYRSAKASLAQTVISLKRLEENIMVSIHNDIGTIRANFDQVQATRAAREYEESALDAEQKKLDSGKSTTYTVLQVQRDLTTARGNEIQALDNYNKSLSQLSLDEGSTLERLGVKLEITGTAGKY